MDEFQLYVLTGAVGPKDGPNKPLNNSEDVKKVKQLLNMVLGARAVPGFHYPLDENNDTYDKAAEDATRRFENLYFSGKGNAFDTFEPNGDMFSFLVSAAFSVSSLLSIRCSVMICTSSR